ncbi:MAG: hypothetical protein VR64_15210 [Desulfatitalea sp. BRH_c12]|nr:MAG: hypothetical protein VR64_15210 [Desulfatitalea sp. BRH_c12]
MSGIPVFFLHGLAYAGLLFLVSAGLTLIFGMMNVLNFAHAAMYMLGAYFSYTIVMQLTGQFWMAMILVPLILFFIDPDRDRTLSPCRYKGFRPLREPAHCCQTGCHFHA